MNLYGREFSILKGRKSVIWGVWAAPGAPEALPEGPRGRPDPQNDRFPILHKIKNVIT
jgi:hypothetical protein